MTIEATETTGVETQPSSITELAPLVQEFIDKMRAIEHEVQLLGEQKKELLEDYSTRIDVKTLKLAMRAAALRDKVTRKDTFDTFMEILDRGTE